MVAVYVCVVCGGGGCRVFRRQPVGQPGALQPARDERDLRAALAISGSPHPLPSPNPVLADGCQQERRGILTSLPRFAARTGGRI